MNIEKDIKAISYVKSNAADILKQINETHRPLYVTQNGEARAVIVDPESYQNLQDSLKLLKILSQSEAEIQSGKTKKQSDFFKSLERNLL